MICNLGDPMSHRHPVAIRACVCVCICMCLYMCVCVCASACSRLRNNLSLRNISFMQTKKYLIKRHSKGHQIDNGQRSQHLFFFMCACIFFFTHLRVKWLICVWNDSFLCDMTHLCKGHQIDNGQTSQYQIFFTCHMTHLFVEWLIYVWNDSFMCGMTHLYKDHQVDNRQRCQYLFCDFFWKSSIPNCFRVYLCVYLYLYLCLRLCTKKQK